MYSQLPCICLQTVPRWLLQRGQVGWRVCSVLQANPCLPVLRAKNPRKHSRPMVPRKTNQPKMQSTSRSLQRVSLGWFLCELRSFRSKCKSFRSMQQSICTWEQNRLTKCEYSLDQNCQFVLNVLSLTSAKRNGFFSRWNDRDLLSLLVFDKNPLHNSCFYSRLDRARWIPSSNFFQF